MDLMSFLIALLALAIGVALGYYKASSRLAGEVQRACSERDHLASERKRAEAQQQALHTRLEAEQRSRVEAETRLVESQRLLTSQSNFVEETRVQLENSFSVLSQKALENVSVNLLTANRTQIEGTKGELVSSLDTKKVEIDSLLQPLREMLTQYKAELSTSEKVRNEAYGGLQEQIRQMLLAQETTQKETSKLVSALRVPNVRGAWGENTLRNCVELAGMSEFCDFSVQETFTTEDGRRLRPDLIIRLPNNRVIVVDSKAPIDAYLEAASETDEVKTRSLLDQHAKNLRKHVEMLSRKEYQSNVGETVDFTVMFLGGEQFLSSALITDPTTFEFAADRKVFLATPTVLLPLLRAVSASWKAERSDENARQALEIGRELYDRFVKVFEHFSGVGSALDGAVKKFNEAIGSIDSKLVPKAMQLQKHVSSSKEVPELRQVERQTLDSSKLSQPRLTILEQEDALPLPQPSIQETLLHILPSLKEEQ